LADIEDGIWAAYRDQGLLLYGVNNENPTILRNFIDQVGITFPVIRGTPEGYTILGGQSPFPRDYIIDPDGIVQYAATEYRPTEISAIIERYLPTGVGGGGKGKVPGPGLPRGFALRQNYPNPFNPSTVIRYDLDPAGGAVEVDLSVFTVRGRRVRTLVSGRVEPGPHEVTWDGRDGRALDLPSGVYLYRLETPRGASVRKMLLVK
jgi:hypothetical protein